MRNRGKLAMLVAIVAVWTMVPAAARADGGPYGSTDMYALKNGNGLYENFDTGGLTFNCDIEHQWQSRPGGPYNGWQSLGGCATYWDVGRNQDGRLEVFVEASDGSIWHKWQTAPHNAPWSGWARLGSAFFSIAYPAPTVFSMPHSQAYVHVYVYDGQGSRWVNYQTSPGCCWRGWFMG